MAIFDLNDPAFPESQVLDEISRQAPVTLLASGRKRVAAGRIFAQFQKLDFKSRLRYCMFLVLVLLADMKFGSILLYAKEYGYTCAALDSGEALEITLLMPKYS